MEKFSFYETLSFLIPGFILLSIISMYLQFVFGVSDLINLESKFEENILLICLSLFAGIGLNALTSWLFKCKYFKWIKDMIMPSVQKISENNSFIQKTIPFLNAEYIKLRKHDEKSVKETEAENNLFDFAYFYLEVNDKISAAKNFQSLYFWFRNMFTLSTFLIPASIIIWLIAIIGDYNSKQELFARWTAALNVILFFLLIPIARWLREKTVEKIMWSYYVERIHLNENKN